MRIVIITDAWEPQVNGVVRTYQNIIAELERTNHTVKVISPSDFKINFSAPGYKEIKLAPFAYPKMARMIDEFHPDAIHIPVEGPLGMAAKFYCWRRGREYSTSFHTHFPDYIAKRAPKRLSKIARDWTIAVMRWFHKGSKTVFVATQSLEDQLKAWGFQNKFVRMVRGVNTDIFFPAEDKPEADKPTLIYVGRVAIEKNIEAFLDLDMNAHKIVVGDGPARQSLEDKYPHVEFLGLQTGMDLGDAYRRADCFVFPSTTDTFGIVLIEAMACGLPVAGYDVTGPKDLITRPELGAVSDDLQTAVEQALNSQGTTQDRHRHVLDNYSWAEVAKIFASQYESLSLK